MKKSLFFVLTMVVFIACNTQSKQNTENSDENSTVELTQTTVNIGGMHCDMCVASVEKGVKSLEGIENVVVSLNDSNAIVKYNAQAVSIQEIEKAIEKRGYSIKK